MDQNDALHDDEKFSEDPEENQRMQNDFLKLKMMAESGAFFGGEGGLPPEIENQFLKNIIEFEKAQNNAKTSTIATILGKPFFLDEKDLNDSRFIIEYKKLEKVLNKNRINVDFITERPDRFKYNFITKELFDHETNFIPAKGMTTHFVYEEFHPDHEQEIIEITHHFLNDFFERKLNADTYYINNELIEPDGKTLSREQLINRFYSLYDVAIQFENTSFILENVTFELKELEDTHSGLGFSDGTINYDLILKGGERKKISGPFKIYFARECDCWSIYFFYLAGYNLHPGKKEDS